MPKYLFLITSVINFKKKPLPYSQTRSIYTPAKRIDQTLKTVKSIREKAPQAKIVLLELGTFSNQLSKLKREVDNFVWLGTNPLVRLAVDSKHRGLGEAIGLIFSYPLLKKKRYDYILKISGRYTLNENFSLSKWKNKNKLSSKVYDGSISTRLYGFSYSFLERWFIGLILSIPVLLAGKSIETIMFSRFKQNLKKLNCIGLSGKIAIEGSEIKE